MAPGPVRHASSQSQANTSIGTRPPPAEKSYKACVTCRSRKVRCDLGDINAPNEPPCARCRRTGTSCVFEATDKKGSRGRTQRADSAFSDDKMGRLNSHPIGTSQHPVENSGLTGNFISKHESTTNLDLPLGRLSGADFDAQTGGRQLTDLESPPMVDSDERHEPPTLLLDSDTFASSILRNPEDALELLVRAGKSTIDSPFDPSNPAPASTAKVARLNRSTHPLILQGILVEQKLTELTLYYFEHLHPLMPMIPAAKVPRTRSELSWFWSVEPELTTAMALITARQLGDMAAHSSIWKHAQDILLQIMLGKAVSVGAIEFLLLISEYLPHQHGVANENLHQEENRLSWMAVGNAVRLGYLIGLDQVSEFDAVEEAVNSPAASRDEDRARERLAWTYCYFFDRHISIRTGKAFWSRGPGLTPAGIFDDTSRKYKSFQFIPGKEDDFASYIHCLAILTQTMSNAHDILYPSKDRTVSLVKTEQYYKYLDDFSNNLNAFRAMFEGRRWNTFPLTECVWITFHYTRLYIYAFCLQAQIQRASKRERPPGISLESLLFPQGLMGSGEARFILESIDAASDLVRLVLDRLHPGNVMGHLPWRFFLYFGYAGVFLIKAQMIVPLLLEQKQVITFLLRKLIACLASSSTDEQHPGVRYARLLDRLLRNLKLHQGSLGGTPVVTRAGSPIADLADTLHDPTSQTFSSFHHTHLPEMRPFQETLPFYDFASTITNMEGFTDFLELPLLGPSPITEPNDTASMLTAFLEGRQDGHTTDFWQDLSLLQGF